MKPCDFLVCFGIVASIGPAAAAAGPDFTREVRPILSNHCFACHGPDDQTRKGKLRLDLPGTAVLAGESGKVAITPGQPGHSEIIARILTDDPDDLMPPPSSKKRLTDREKEILRAWVAAGAEYRPHWSFVAPARPAVPAVAGVTHPVDAFIRDRLAREGLSPAREADRSTLIRRVHLDLTGIPPTPEEVRAFVRDPAPDAYERLVDRLLASPHYGERWARQWMDLARYADTNGYEKDRGRTIWPWRDWLIGALNADMPFDRFSIEQVAGDMLPNATRDQRVATGFHRNTMINEEGGIDPLEFRYHAMADRMHVTGAAWLGLTLQCAQCHTHKYDPITHTGYFGMMAFLNNAEEPEMEIDDPPSPEKRAADLRRAEQILAGLPAAFPVADMEWVTARPTRIQSGSGQAGALEDDGSVMFPMPPPPRDVWTLEFTTDAANLAHLRLEALTDPTFPQTGPGRAPNGNFVLTELSLTAAPADGTSPPVPVKLLNPAADASQDKFPVAHAVDGKADTGWAIHTDGTWNVSRTARFDLEKPVSGPTRWVVRLEQNHGGQHTLGRIRLQLGAPVSGAAGDRRDRLYRAALAEWTAQAASNTVAWTSLTPVEMSANVPFLTLEEDNVVFVRGDLTKQDIYTLAFAASPTPVTAIRLEALPDIRLPNRGPGRVYYEGPMGSFTLTDITALVDGGTSRFTRASASFASGKLTADKAIDDEPQSGWDINGGQGRAHQAVFVLGSPVPAGKAFSVRMVFERHYAAGLGKFRLSATSAARVPDARDLPVEIEPDLLAAESARTPAQRARIERQFLLSAPVFADKRKEAERLLQGPGRGRTTLVMQERPAGFGRKTFRHHRGEYLQAAEEVQPATLSFLHPLPAGEAPNRLGFARWLVSPDNPLTPRVVVNRAWATLFRTGLVATVEDFGLQGETPSHPELLDWLARELVAQGWSMKRLHRLLVTSATYRQESRVDPASLARDPNNRLLARAPRPRLEAEQIRDAALLAAGVLSPKMFGPGVFPPQPASITTEGTYGSFQWKVSEGEDRYRRGLYTYMKRTAPFAMTNTFDAPSGEACLARREMTNTPLQALTLLNDQVLVEAAQKLGARLAGAASADDTRVTEAFLRCLAREPGAEETAGALAFVIRQRERFRADEAAAKAFAGEGQGSAVERAAWTALARALLNVDEFITRN